MNSTTEQQGAAKNQADIRRERLAKALKENIKRRKESNASDKAQKATKGRVD